MTPLPTPLQVQPSPGTPIAFLGTLLVGWLFFSFTAHVAASYVLGDVPWRRALLVGAVPAVVTLALGQLPAAAIIAVALLADLAAFHLVYRVRYRTAALAAVFHYVASLALVLLVTYGLGLLGTAPG